MDNETLHKVHMVLLEIGIEFRRVCNILNLRYFLDSGTLLGAVRHKGFIPWDDDFDVAMLREDYEIFISKAQDVLGPKYFLQTWDTDSCYGLPFAKLRMKDTVYLEKKAQFSKAQNGFYIDIFPYDVYPQGKVKRISQGFIHNMLRNAILAKSGYAPWESKNFFKQIIMYLLFNGYAATHSRNGMIKRFQKNCTRFNSRPTGLIYPQGGATKYGKWVIPSKCLKETIEMDFENEKFMCPIGYDEYLREAYGDYMTPPPIEKRYNRHEIVSIHFNEQNSGESKY